MIKKHLEKIKLTRWDVLSILILILFVLLISYPGWAPRGDCEVARPGYECASLEDVMIENCVYWGQYDCDTNADVSLEQVEWYIHNLCDLQNREHETGLECSNLRRACNQIIGNQTCGIGV